MGYFIKIVQRRLWISKNNDCSDAYGEMKFHATFHHKGKDEAAYRNKRGKVSKKWKKRKERKSDKTEADK